MTRRLLNLLTAVSLLLCVATVAVWGASCVRRLSLSRYDADGHGTTAIHANPDGLYLWRDDSHYGKRFQGQWDTTQVLADPRVAGVLGFGAGGDELAPVYRNPRYYRMPYWFPLALTAILPACRFVRRGRRQGRTRICPRCGYDLCATPDRCPECGHTPKGARA